MGGLQEPCNIFAGNRSAHGVHNLKWFGKCAFILKKGAVVRKLLHRKVGKVTKNGCVRVVGWCGGGAPSILQQNACNCLASIIASQFNFTCKKNMKISTPAAFEQSQSAPKSQPKISQCGGVCSGGAARRVCRFGVCRLHCEHALG